MEMYINSGDLGAWWCNYHWIWVEAKRRC